MKTKTKWKVLAFVILLVGCERESRELGGVSEASAGNPRYSLSASASSVPREAHVASVSPGGEKVLDGAVLYAQNCAACHQVNGEGVPSVFPPLNKSSYVTGDNIERLSAIVVYGLMGPIKVNGQTFNSVMTPMGALDDQSLAAILTYIRSAWDNKASPVDATPIKMVREKFGTRGPFNINELGEEQ